LFKGTLFKESILPARRRAGHGVKFWTPSTGQDRHCESKAVITALRLRPKRVVRAIARDEETKRDEQLGPLVFSTAKYF
jgi:hypothetical protein